MDEWSSRGSGAQSRFMLFRSHLKPSCPHFICQLNPDFLKRPNIYIRRNYKLVHSFRIFVPYTLRSAPMAKKKTAVPPEQAAGPSLIICRNK
jgi:hypothetical protein